MILPLVSLPSQAGGSAASMRFVLHLLWSSLATLDNNRAPNKTIMDYKTFFNNCISVIMASDIDREDSTEATKVWNFVYLVLRKDYYR